MTLLLLVACPAKDDSADSCLGDQPWSLVAEQLGDSMLLGAWDDGGPLYIVGGNLSGGGGDLLVYDGQSVCRHDSITEQPLWWIHVVGEDWVAVGEAGTVLRSSGERIDAPTPNTLFGVWMDGEVITAVGGAVGSNTGEVWRYQGGEWTALATELPGLVFKVFEHSFVGDGVYGFEGEDGIAWQETELRMVTVHGQGADQWVVGGDFSSMVAHLEGGSWVEQDATWLGQPLNGVFSGRKLWATGNFGAQGWWDGSRWQVPDFPLTSEVFHAVREYGDETLFFGGNFLGGGSHGTIGRWGESPSSADWTLSPCP